MSSQAAPQLTPLPDGPAPLSEFSRIIGVYANPKAAFTDIVARPKWYLPVILLALAGLCFSFLLNQHVGFDRIIQQQFDQNPKAQSIPPAQRALSVKIGTITAFVGAVIAPLITVLISAAVLMFLANAMVGSQLSYLQMASITAYAFLTGLISTALATIVLFIRSPDDFDPRNPLAFNLGAFLNSDTTPKWLLSLATSIDIFTFWTIALIAIGIMVSSRRLTFSKTLPIVLIPWVILVIVKVSFAAITG